MCVHIRHKQRKLLKSLAQYVAILALLSTLYRDFARFMPVSSHLDVSLDPVSQAVNVADDADFAFAAGVEMLEGIHHGVQIFTAERAETLVDEQGLHREAVSVKPRKRQRQRQ